MIKKFFTGSIVFTIVAVIIWFFLGAGSSMNIVWWLQAVFIILILWVLETSLSFDNAVVNATVLEQMEPKRQMIQFLSSSIRWIIVYTIVDSFAQFLGKRQMALKTVAKAWLSLFVYLEILDASFSFDGVIGAFALSKNIFIIALWLWIGAMFVRSLTILLVKKGTLTKYKYLEHGAFWAILSLAIVMFISTTHHVPEVITGLLGAGFIGISFRSSVRANKRLANHWKKNGI